SLSWFNGGLSGWTVDEAQLFGMTLTSLDADHVRQIFWLILGIFAIITVLVVNLHDSDSGRRFRAIRDSELAAATMGVDLTRYKLLAFGMSAAIAGLGGAFYPLVAGSVSPQPFWLFTSLQFAAIAVLMGVRYVPAAALVGVFMGRLADLVTRFGHGTFMGHAYEISYDWFQLALGALLIAQLILLPDGVWGDIRRRVHHARASM